MTFARIRAIVIVSVLVVAAILRDNETGPVGAGCPKDAVIADTRLPEPSEVKINVYNASERPGLANQVKTDDVNRKDDIVDVVLGTQFRQLATVTEFHQALAQLGNPTLPEGTCNKNAR